MDGQYEEEQQQQEMIDDIDRPRFVVKEQEQKPMQSTQDIRAETNIVSFNEFSEQARYRSPPREQHNGYNQNSRFLRVDNDFGQEVPLRMTQSAPDWSSNHLSLPMGMEHQYSASSEAMIELSDDGDDEELFDDDNNEQKENEINPG